MTRRISYCLFSGIDLPEGSDEIVLSGLFSWVPAFREFGKSGTTSTDLACDSLEQYDVIHVNYTPKNASYVAAIRDSIGFDSDTKIVVNVDYAINMWSSIDPFVMRQQLALADVVFHVEPVGAARLSRFLDRKVYTVPHPVDVGGVKKYQKPTSLPTIVACQYHRYMYTWSSYFYATYQTRKKFGVRTALMNHSGDTAVALDSMFDAVVGRMPYPAYLQALADCYINVDLAPDYTYGRGVVEAAALGVPTVGSEWISAIRRLFPTLAVSPHNDRDIRQRLEELLTNPDQAAYIAKNAMDSCEYYNLENSCDRLTRVVGDVCD